MGPFHPQTHLLTSEDLYNAAVPNLFGTKDQFHGSGSGFRMIQALYIHCTLYFYFHYINSTIDHQALDPGVWGPLFWGPAILGAMLFLPQYAGHLLGQPSQTFAISFSFLQFSFADRQR